MKFLRFASFLFAALLVLIAEKDACGQWKNVAPNLVSMGQSFGCLTYKDGILWAGNKDLWFSQDSGKIWQKSNFNSTNIYDIDFFDRNNGLVSTMGNGLFLTRDGGQSWININPTTFWKVSFNNSKDIIHGTAYGYFYTSTDGGVTWRTSVVTNYYATCSTILKSGVIVIFGGFPKGGASFSSDLGITWKNSPAIVDGDCNTISSDSCNPDRLYLLNENYASPGDGFSKIYVSTDAGQTWMLESSHPVKYYSGTLSNSQNAIFAASINYGIERSTDRGLSWKNYAGPTSNGDSRSIACLNDNILFALDGNGSVWATFNSGGDSLSSFPGNGILNLSQKILFTLDTVRCSGISRFSKISLSGCNPPMIIRSEIRGKDSLSYSIIPLAGDSIGITLDPKDSGQQDAILLLALNDGTVDTIVLSGYNMPPHTLSMTTHDQSTDTVGGSISIPISIDGLDHAEDIDLVLEYNQELTYHGSFSPANITLDVPNEQWIGRSKLHIPQAKSNTILGYARFDVFNDSSSKSQVTFDSVTVLTAISPCQYILPASVTSTITGPSGCGSDIISRFMHNGSMPQLSIIPNPTGGEISISSTGDLGQCSVAIYDMLGNQKGMNMMTISQNAPAKLALPAANGVYNVRVRSAGKSWDLRVVVSR
ncbi:MAG: T9SS type A sorting domain-containing protein [Candidatus Kapaibacterium sp.]